MIRPVVLDAVVELRDQRAKPPRENLHWRLAVRLGWPTTRARGAVTNPGIYHADSQGLR